MLQRRSERAEFAKRIPAQIVFLLKLLNVFRGGAACTGLEQAATVHQWYDGQHLGRRADFQDRIKVGQVIAQHVACDGDGVLAAGNALGGVFGCLGRRHDLQIETGRVVLGQVGVDLLDQLGIVATLLVQPEDAGHAGEARPGDAELDPVADRCVLGAAGTPDIAFLDFVRDQRVACFVDNSHDAGSRGLEGLWVRAVFLGLLRHQADIRHRTHLGRIKRAVLTAEVDHR